MGSGCGHVRDDVWSTSVLLQRPRSPFRTHFSGTCGEGHQLCVLYHSESCIPLCSIAHTVDRDVGTI